MMCDRIWENDLLGELNCVYSDIHILLNEHSKINFEVVKMDIL